MNDVDFSITIEGFNEGNAPLAHLDDETFVGNKGQASDARCDLISTPGFLTQSPGLANLTNGTQAGAVTELIRFILDKPTATDVTYALGLTKFFKLSSTAVTNTGGWPQTITNMTSGECLIRLKANLYGFYNKSSGGDIFKMPLATETVDPDWGSATDAALESAPHPAAVKEDIMLFGNGRYIGVYIEGAATLDVQKLDFGEGSEVADVVFNSNFWWIAVNYADGKRSQIYLYDGSAMSSILSDEAGVGDQEIGFLYVLNGILYIAYQDKSSSGFTIGWLSGRTIKPLRYFSGSLPDHRQKALYKNCILFVSSTDIWSVGAPVQQLPIQISKLADGGYSTVGGIAAPFGVPMVASSQTVEEVTSARLAKFSGLSTDSYWKSIWVDLTKNKNLGQIMSVIVQTKALEADAKAEITLEGNQGDETSNTLEITGEGKTRFVFDTITLNALEDVRVNVSYANGNTAKNCPIRKITLLGSYAER
jgi:hypothetical protein